MKEFQSLAVQIQLNDPFQPRMARYPESNRMPLRFVIGRIEGVILSRCK